MIPYIDLPGVQLRSILRRRAGDIDARARVLALGRAADDAAIGKGAAGGRQDRRDIARGLGRDGVAIDIDRLARNRLERWGEPSREIPRRSGRHH